MKIRQNNTTVTRIQPGTIDWNEDLDNEPITSLARRPQNYVPAAPPAPRFEVLPPEIHGAAPVVQPTAIVETRVTGDHLNRAQGFALVSSVLAAVVGVLAVLAVFVGFGQPWGVLPVLMWFWAGFAVTWLIAWALHLLLSPDGNAVLHTMGLWGYMRREQKERWAFYNRQLDRMEDHQ